MQRLNRSWRLFGLLLLIWPLVLAMGCNKENQETEESEEAAQQNACQRAVAYMMGCLTEYCAENGDNPFCDGLDEMVAEAADTGEDCFDDDAVAAHETLEISCEEHIALLGIAPTPPPADVIPPDPILEPVVPDPAVPPAEPAVPPADPAVPDPAATPPPG